LSNSGESVSRNLLRAALWRSFVVAVWLVGSLMALPVAAPAQQAASPGTPPVDGLVADQAAIIDGLAAQVDLDDKAIIDDADNDIRLVEIRLNLEDVLDKVLVSGVAFRPRVSEINNRLEQLGPAPAAGQPPEPERVQQERQALTAEKAEINVLLGKAEDLSVRINGLLTKISTLRRDLFTNLLTKRYELSDTIGNQVTKDVIDEGRTLRQRIGSSLWYVYTFQFKALTTAIFIALLVAAAAHLVGKRLFGALITRDPAIEHPSYVSRLSVAFWSALLPAVAQLLFLVVVWTLFESYSLLNIDVRVFLIGFMAVLALGAVIYRLSHAVLSPDMPNWRLIDVERRPARVLIWLMTALALIVGFDWLAGVISDRLGSPLSVTIVKGLFAAILSGLVIMTIAQVRPFADSKGEPQRWPGWFRAILYIVGVGSIFAAIAGYVSLAQFISAQIVVTGAILTTAYIGLLASRAISEEGGFAKTGVGRWLRSSSSMDDAQLDQLGVLSSVVINILLVIAFMPFVLFQWGFQPGDIAAWMRRAAGGFQIGSFSFSPFAIVTGVIVFVLGYIITRWFQSWLDGTVMARGKVDPGVRNSIRTVVGYAGYALAGLIAISSAGLDLSNLALIAGGLSLGIGFGLQNIVSNFVSGLILLAERPLKVGDWVEAGAVSGTVKKISVRATEIETFQRQTVILPNSILINGAVGNWTHRNRLGRIEVPVGVTYKSDPRKVHEVLLDIVRNHPMILKNPEPTVLFTGFTDIALTFEIRGFLADVYNGAAVRNDLRFNLVDALAREGIELAYTLKPAEKEEASDAIEPAGDTEEGKTEKLASTTQPAPPSAGQKSPPKRARKN